MTTTASEPTLLGLPPELRNRIYAAALVEKDAISIKYYKNRKQPDLLSVNRLIRQEAIGIYYNDNDFFYEACLCKGAALLPFCKLQKQYRSDHRVTLPTVICHHRNYLHIANLWEWLQAYHTDADAPAPAQDCGYNRRESKVLVVRMFGVVDAMRMRPWRKVARVLAVLFDCVEGQEEMWSMEADDREVYGDEFERLYTTEEESDDD